MEFSVVICTYNSAAYIQDCLESICQQRRAPLELIVVDGGSRDATQDIVQSYQPRLANLQWIPQGETPGLAYARNLAVQAARGDYVAFLDADARAESDWLELAARILGQNPDIVALGGQGQEIVVSPADLYRSLYFQQGWGRKPRSDVKFLFGLNSIYRKEILLAAGCFDPEFLSSGEDVELGLKLRGQGHVLHYDPGLLVHHARRDDWKSLDLMVQRWSYFGRKAGLKHGVGKRPFLFWLVWVTYRTLRYWATEWWKHPNLRHFWLRPYHYFVSARASVVAERERARDSL